MLDLPTEAMTVYESLIDRAASNMEELTGALGMPKAQLQQALETLENKGLIGRVPGSGARYRAIAPEIALEVLLLQREEEIKRARRHAEQLSIRFQRAAAGQDPAELVEILVGVPAIRQRWEQLHQGARHEVRGIDKPPYTVPQPESPAQHVEHEMLQRGVKYRIIYDSSGLDGFHRWKDDLEFSISRGEHARVLNNAPTKLVIFDDRYAMIPLQAAPATIVSMILVHRSGLLEALCALFESLWQQALPLAVGSAGPSDPDRPTPDEARLLALLVTGVQDEVIAKQLGMSYRTFQRRLHDLMSRLGAETRFQAGLRAGLRGWIE